jgi:hypothetical protein
MITLIVIPPFPVPEVGEGEIQDELFVTDQASVPPPLFVMATVCAGGLLPPCWAVKDRLDGLAPIAGGTGAALTVKETGTVTGVTPVPPLSVTRPRYVAGVKVPVVTFNVTAPLPVPEAGLRVNQAALSLADQLSVPPPVLRILSV